MAKKKAFEDYIIKAILANKEFNICEIKDLENIKSMVLLRDKYSSVLELVKLGQVDSIKALDSNENKASEYLDIYIFKDQENEKYIVTLYDSNELWQDPEVWDIFKLNN